MVSIMENTPMNTITNKDELSKEWMSIGELEDVTRMKRDTQAKYRKNKNIPFYKIGSRIFYKASEINEWLLSHKAGA